MPKVTVPNPSWWMAWHSSALSSWQCAYAENVHLRNPEYVTLWQRSESVCSTGTSLMLCMDDFRGDLVAGEDGKVYKLSDWSVLYTAASWANAINMKEVGNYYYLSFVASSGSYEITRILTSERLSADWTAAASFTQTHSSHYMTKTVFKWGELLFWFEDDIYSLDNDASGTIASLQDLGTAIAGRVVWLWDYGQDTKALASWWQYSFLTVDGSNTIMRLNLSAVMMAWFTKEWQEYMIAGIDNESSALYMPSWYGKQLVAKAVTDTGIESKKKFHFGRTDELHSESTSSTRMRGDDVVDSYSGITYTINKGKLLSWWSHYRGLPLAWDYATVTNSAGDTLTSIWFVKYALVSGTPYIYYSWKNSSGDCWVDRIDVSSHEPAVFHDSWVWYTQKFIFWDVRAKLHGFRVRAYTTPWQKFDVYISLDGWSYELLQTFDNTDPKLYTEIQKHYEAYECQFKIVPSTDDTALAPKRYWFTFMADGIDG